MIDFLLLDPCSTPADMPTAEDTLFQRFGKEFPKGTVLFHEGETGKEMFVLQAGKVVITKTVRDTVKTLATLGPGSDSGAGGRRPAVDFFRMAQHDAAVRPTEAEGIGHRDAHAPAARLPDDEV